MPHPLRAVVATTVVEKSHPYQRYAARFSQNPYLRVAAWEHLRTSGDIFDDNLEPELDERKDHAKVKTLDDCLAAAGLMGTKWFAKGAKYREAFLGVRNGKIVVVKISSTAPSKYGIQIQQLREAAEQGFPYFCEVKGEVPMGKDMLKALAALPYIEYVSKWLPVDPTLKPKDMRSSMGSGLALKDVLILGGILKGPPKRIPIVDLIIEKNPVAWNAWDLTTHENPDGTKKSDMANFATSKVFSLSINGRVWELDPDTMHRMYKWEVHYGRDIWNRDVTINLNKSRAIPMGEYLSQLLNNLTREPTSLILELSRVVEWLEDNKKVAAAAVETVL